MIDVNYLVEFEGFCQRILTLLYFWSQFLRKIGWFKMLEVGKESLGFNRSPLYNTYSILTNLWVAKTLDFLPKSLVELNSILLKITFGSYKFFGFFKRATYNSKF
jgi:hypothetical protein